MTSICSYSYPPEFEEKGYSIDGKHSTYRVNENTLSSDECHMYYPIECSEEMAIATGVEFFAFHPSKKALNEKFKMCVVDVGGISLFHCSFPKTAKDLCVRIGKMYNMTLTNESRTMLGCEKGKAIEVLFPKAEHILHFQGRRSNDPKFIRDECELLRGVANAYVNHGLL